MHAPLYFLPLTPLLCLLLIPQVPDEKPAPEALARLARVSGRLLDVTPPHEGYQWPPRFVPGGKGDSPLPVWRPAGKSKRIVIKVPPSIMGLSAEAQDDAFALLLGPALAHVTLGHTIPEDSPDGRNPFTERERLEAEPRGAELMLRAGYSLAQARRGLGGLKGWEERLDHLDNDQERLGRVMPAYNEGIILLMTEQYALAELCFERVVKEFVGCQEAWTALGYARMMLYLDNWTTRELGQQGVGMVPLNAFCKRTPGQQFALRGKNRKLWWDATDALREGLRQCPGQVEARVALGLAYLFHPDKQDGVRAVEYLTEAFEAAVAQKASPAVRAGVLIHLAVARLAAGQTKEGFRDLDRAEELAGGGPPSLAAALLYNRALLLAASHDKASREKATGMFRTFLTGSNPLSLWWELAYEQHARLLVSLGHEPVSKKTLSRTPVGNLKPRAGVRLARGGTVAAGDDTEGLEKLLGPWKAVTVVRGMNLVRLRPEKHPLELLVTDRVLAVCLTRRDSLPVRLGEAGILHPGLKVADLDALLGREYRVWDWGGQRHYRYYPEQGIAVRTELGKVVEVILVRVPGQ